MPSDKDTNVMSRRRAIRGLGTVGVALGSTAIGINLSTQPSVAATTSLSASNVSITSDAGQLTALYVQPSIDYEWDGLNYPPQRVDFYVSARLSNNSTSAGSYEQIGTEGETISSGEYESLSTHTYDFQSQLSILGHSGISDTDFEKTGDDWTKNTDVDVKVQTELTDDVGNVYTDTNSATFTVSLTDEPGSANGGGRANPGGAAN